ncbi:cytochrome C551 [Chryseobacterium sp. T16E-39]|uniref:cytochrome C551 n=1 Tax=Chryseobacterium sp. T16E-39 TaxID=2015076 RepID=UPI000B5B1441|nr:cytochrome C551 [Chryseobacterium sp. T16E-39]ASK30070.1 cytochrome C551 [Chryseobacterium sp. T16E-39]
MKKLMLLTLGLGIFAVSCGTKEAQMSSGNKDSTAVDQSVKPTSSTTDTMNTKMTTPDSIKMKMDTVKAPATR